MNHASETQVGRDSTKGGTFFRLEVIAFWAGIGATKSPEMLKLGYPPSSRDLTNSSPLKTVFLVAPLTAG